MGKKKRARTKDREKLLAGIRKTDPVPENKKQKGREDVAASRRDSQIIPTLSLRQQRWLYGLGLVLVVSLIAKLFFSSGHTYSLDGASLTARTIMAYESLLDGEFPLWSNRWYAGFPLMQFYPPLFFGLTALLNLLIKDILFSIKIMAFLGQILSGLTAFLLVEEITDDRQAGFIGGLAFALAPWHIFQILDFCRLTVIFIYTLLPLPFLFFEKYRHQKLSLPQAGILSGLSLSMIIGFHYAYAPFITLLFVYYVILNSISFRKPFLNLQHMWLIGITGLVSLGTALAFIGPYALESHYLINPLIHLSYDKFTLDSATFSTLFTRQEFPQYHKGYIGLSFLVLSILGIFSALRRKKYPLLAIYAFCFYLVLGYETAIYKYIPLIYAQLATERLILYLILFMAVMAGEGIKLLKSGLSPLIKGRGWQILFFVLAVICFLDVGVTNDRRWAQTHSMAQSFKNFSQKLAKSDLPHVRTIRSYLVCSEPRIQWMFANIFPSTLTVETPSSIIRGDIRFLAGRGLPYIDDGKSWVQRDLEVNKRILSTQELLYLLNISYVFYVDNHRKNFILNNPRHTPAIASGQIGWQKGFSAYHKPGAQNIVEPFIRQLGLNMEHNSARQLFLVKDLRLPDRPFNENSSLRILNFEQTTNKSLFDVEASHDCYLQLSHSYYPFLHVYLDDNEAPFYETALGTIAVPLPAGRHQIKVEPYFSPIRKVCYILNLIFLVLAVAFYQYFKIKPAKPE